MTKSQRVVISLLVVAVIGVCSGLTFFVGRDLLTDELVPLASSIRATPSVPIKPTVIWVWPTITPTPVLIETTAAQAIAFIQTFKYDQSQQKNLLDLINTLQSASQKLGNELSIDGWDATRQDHNRWVVTYNYREGATSKAYQFLVDLDTQYIKAQNEGGDTILRYLQQDAEADNVNPTATPVTLFVGWATRDYFTNWDYHVPTLPQRVNALRHLTQTIQSEAGFLVIPLTLHNIGQATKTLRSDYYTRFTLRDSSGREAGLSDLDHLRLPTRLYCRSLGLPEWTEKNVSVPVDANISTALVFELQPGAQPPYTLEITVHELNTPHRYQIKLELSST